MMEWFRSGGFGMFLILVVGAGSIGFGARVVGKPTRERVAVLRSLPTLIGLISLFSFGTGMWAVNVHLTDESFLKAASISAADKAFTALIGVTEATQTLTLGAILAIFVVVLRMVAEARAARSST